MILVSVALVVVGAWYLGLSHLAWLLPDLVTRRENISTVSKSMIKYFIIKYCSFHLILGAAVLKH